MKRRTFTQELMLSGLGTLGLTTACRTRVPKYPMPPTTSLPNPVNVRPQDSGIEHVVIVTMENRSFDHLLGWLGAAGIPAGLRYADNSGAMHSPYSLAPDYTGCGHPVPNNSYGSANSIAYDSGKMDGFLRVPGNDIYSIGYYGAQDLPFLAALAQAYLVCDHWFAPIQAETYPNRMFLWAAQTDRLSNTLSLSGLPTIFDSLTKQGISHQYYFGNVPFLALWGLKYVSASSLFEKFISDASSGNLPAVSFVDPKFTILDDGLGNDDHPHSDVRNGDAFLAQVFHGLASSPKWSSTVLVVTFDEWGGFFEHVAPPRVVAPNNVDTNLVNGEALLGFRVPTIIASPFTRNAKRVDSTLYDHTAALKLIEWRWALPPLSLRDASPAIGNPVASFNLSSPDPSIPVLPEVRGVPAKPCFLKGPAAPNETIAPSNALAPTEFRPLNDSQIVRDWMKQPEFQTAPR